MIRSGLEIGFAFLFIYLVKYMIITKGIVNKVGFTLAELSICDEPAEYRMVFTSENSPAISYELVKTPINTGKRLQIFEIDEPTEVDFQLEGYYSYEIYQTTSNNLVETGLIMVEGPEEVIPTVTQSSNPQVYVGQ